MHHTSTYTNDKSTFAVKLVDAETSNNGGQEITKQYAYAFWPAYRAWALSLQEHEYEQAYATAKPLFESWTASLEYDELTNRAWLAFVFSKEPEWATGLVEQAIDSDNPKKRARLLTNGAVLLPALTDPALALEFVQTCGNSIARNADIYAFDIVESLGKHAAPVLEALQACNGLRSSHKKAFAAAKKLAEKST